MPHVREIETLTKESEYRVHIGWAYLERWLADMDDSVGLDLAPDFQRGHVWTPAQRSAYVEFIMRGGRGADELRFNCVDWMAGRMEHPLLIVDGLQRLTAVRGFLADEVPAFGHRASAWEGVDDPLRYRFTVMVNNLPTRTHVLRWYIEINSAGTPHGAEEIERVQALLDAEPEPAP